MSFIEGSVSPGMISITGQVMPEKPDAAGVAAVCAMPHSGACEKELVVTADLAGGNTMLRFCRSLAWIAATLVALPFAVAAAPAQTSYPDRPVKIIVPIGPGGSYDLVGPHLADVLSKRTGQALLLEDKPSACTAVATLSAAQSAPAGY